MIDDCSYKIISPFDKNSHSGHLLLDDLFYYEIADLSLSKFSFFTNKYSKLNIDQNLSTNLDQITQINVNGFGIIKDKFSWLEMIKLSIFIPIKSNDKVIFLGYTEKLIFVFILMNIFKKFKLTLVSTNNYSSKRVNQNKNLLNIFFKLINLKLISLIVHTEKEKNLITGVNNSLCKKIFVKKHHLMISDNLNVEEKTDNKNPIISFYGKDNDEKPIQPLIDLIKNDHNSFFEYRAYKAQRIDFINYYKNKNNVQIINSYLTYKEYKESINKTTLILLTHNHLYEGKLSGNFCDCIRHGIPFISGSFEPLISFNKQYGPLGFIVDFSDASWAEIFFKDYHNDINLKNIKNNLLKIKEDFSRNSVMRDNIDKIFN
jgi:hypothetical protein